MNELSNAAKTDEERRTLRDATYYGLYALDGRRLEPYEELTVDVDENYMGPRDLKLISFASHLFYEYRQVQLAPAGNLISLGATKLFHKKGNIGKGFSQKPLPDMPRSDEPSFFAIKG